MTTYSIVVTDSDGTDTDITAKTTSASWDRELGDASSTLDLSCFNLAENYTMYDITLTVDSVVRFVGIVKSQTNTKNETQFTSSLKCIDNTDKLQRLIVAESYADKTAKQMIVDLISNYASWVNTDAVKDIGGSIDSMFFNYDTLSVAIQKLADMVGAYWYLDSDDGLHFFDNYETTTSVVYKSSSNILQNSFQLETTAIDLVNRVWVIGAKAAATNYIDQYWTGDGNNDIFTIAYIPNYPDVYEDGTAKTIEVDQGVSSSKDYTYNKKEKVLKRTAGALTSGVVLHFHYRPTVQIIDYFEDPASVATYGLYEKAIRDKKITDKIAARKRGRSELKRTKALIKKPSWTSRSWQVSPGELTAVQVTSFAYSASCRIDRISVSFAPDDIVASIEATEVFTS